MNEHFLVVISTALDDLPVCLRLSEASARDWAKTCDPELEDEKAFNLRGTDTSDSLACVRIVKFVDGVPVSDEVVRDLEADDEIGGAS